MIFKGPLVTAAQNTSSTALKCYLLWAANIIAAHAASDDTLLISKVAYSADTPPIVLVLQWHSIITVLLADTNDDILLRSYNIANRLRRYFIYRVIWRCCNIL